MKRGTGRKIGFYELIAERLVDDKEAEENPMDRGVRLESEAIEAYEKLTGEVVKKNEDVWVSDSNPNIAISPDGEVHDELAIEVKCLASSRHLQAYFEKCVPDDYESQVLQYFIVNEKLLHVDVIFYDPRIPTLPIHVVRVNREDVEEQIKFQFDYQVQVLKEVKKLVEELTF